MNLVLDASMALAWLFERTKPAELACADRALSVIAESSVYVPALWHTEVGNALLVAERRGVITEAQVADFTTRLYRLPLITDDAAPSARREVVVALAREHKLTAYDATYLDLALRFGAVLATFDAALAGAMRTVGGEVFA